MAAALRASAAYRTNILHLVRPSGGVSLSHLSNAALGPPAFLRNGGLPKNRCGSSIEYSTNVGPGGRVMRWLSRRILAVLALAGLTGGALLVIRGQMQAAVDELSWVERFHPSNIAKGMAEGLGSISSWLKSTKTEQPLSSSSSSSSSSTQQEALRTPQVAHAQFDSSKDRLLTSEVQEMQARVQSLERENHDLRQELAKTTGVDPSRLRSSRKQSLIELYTDVLNLLSEFEARASRKDGKFVNTLPQVVVVGDQSAGKTSVLEMVAGARIFPRGAGEMMTRSPVMVTLSDGPDHIAQFRDSRKVYTLDKEADLVSLRKEIERRMRESVQASGKTISSQPISLVVYGPHLKRMVLVDLPGIISTVTTGMVANTREEIIKMCRQYMENPNAIIMCVQDGSVDAERSMVTDLASQSDPEGHRTIFVLTKADMAEANGIKQERMTSILDGRLFPMKALGYYAVITGKGNTGDSIGDIQKYEREYFARSKLFQNGMLRESQLSTRNMVNAVTEEFWKMVNDSIHDQALHFKTLRYNLEAEWRNKYPGSRTLDRDDLFELGKADILSKVAGLQMREPAKWEALLMSTLWEKVAPHVLTIFMEAAQGHSAGEFNTSVDIELHKWAESLDLAQLCANVGMDTMFSDLHSTLEYKGDGFHMLSQGLREEVERVSRAGHQWESYNVDQLKYVQMSALDDKDVPSAEQWRSAVEFMTSALQKKTKEAEEALWKLEGPTSYYDRWVLFKSQTDHEIRRKAIAEELSKFLAAEPSHPSKLYSDEVITIQRVLKTRGFEVPNEEVSYTWKFVYNLHFLKQAEHTAQKCQKGYVLRRHSPEVPLGVLLKNEARGDDMADIMAHLHQYVPTVDYAEDNTLSKYQPSDTVQFHRILIGGDQMTAARARSSKKHMANHPKPAGRLEGLEPMVEDWHTKASLLGYACPEVEYFWRVKQVMKSSAHTLRVQILDREVRQLEQQVKNILDAIAIDEAKKKELIRGEAVDKAEQLRQVRMIQERLDIFREALSSQKKRMRQ